MVAGLSTQNAACEDQSSTWSNTHSNFTPVTSVVSAVASGERHRHATAASSRSSSYASTKSSSSSSSSSTNSRRANKHRSRVVPDEIQDASVNEELNCRNNSSAKTRAWSTQVETPAAVPDNTPSWNGAAASSSRVSGTTTKSAGASSTAAAGSPTSAKREASFIQRIAEWELNTTVPSNDVCGAAVQPVAAASTTTCDDDGDSRHSSRSSHSSPALSASEESKQSSNSPKSPSLSDDVAVEEAATAVEELSSVLLHTLPAEETTAAVAAAAVEPSFITPCASFTESPTSSSASLSPSPSFTMADIVAALRSAPEGVHPFLDMDYQYTLREHERAEEQLNQQVVKSFQHQFSNQQQAVFFKCLLNEAHRRQYQQCMNRDPTAAVADAAEADSGARAPSCAGRWGPRQRRLIQRQWRMTAEQMEYDLYREGIGAVQRKLSCMCLFNPDTDVRVYDENCNMREQRCYRQHKLLIRLQRQRIRGGNPYFLDAAQ